jgi:CRP-like cAMP-binding protein
MAALRHHHSRLAALRATPGLGSWPERALLALLPYFDEVRLPAGRRIAVEGRPCAQFLVVLEGELEACSASAGTRRLGPGASSGWEAMWDRGANEATLWVPAGAKILVMGHAQFRALKAQAVDQVA